MVQWSKFARGGHTPDLRTRWGQSVIIKSSIAGSLLKYLVGSLIRVPTVREKSVKNEKSSRSGKSQGIFS